MNNRNHLATLPLISVIIPCHNQARFLSDAVDSAIAQDYGPIEIILVDDGSTENLDSAVAGRQIRWVRQEHGGLAAARNTGLRLSKGQYLIFLDADDRLLPGAARAGFELLEANPDCALAYGKYRLIAEDGSPLAQPEYKRVELDTYTELLRRNFIVMHAAVMYRRSAFDAVGEFDVSLSACEDWDLYLRVARHLSVCNHLECVAEYRQHGSNMTRSSELMFRTAFATLRKQRRYVRSGSQQAKARRAGMRFIREHYGGLLGGQIWADLLQLRWRTALHRTSVLVFQDPRGCFIYLSLFLAKISSILGIGLKSACSARINAVFGKTYPK